MSNTLIRQLVLGAILVCAATELAASPEIVVVYPKPNQVIHSVDSTFIFGHVTADLPAGSWLEINGTKVSVHSEGGFLAFLPVSPGGFSFDCTIVQSPTTGSHEALLHLGETLSALSVPVRVPQPASLIPSDTLIMAGDYLRPGGDLVLITAQMLPVYFRGSPGMRAWFSIPGVVDSVPMSEMSPQQQPYWGEAVFGRGAVPDSVLVRGVYVGFFMVPESASAADLAIEYNLAPPIRTHLVRRLLPGPAGMVNRQILKLLRLPGRLQGFSSYRVSFNPPEYPFTVEFIDSVQIVRHGPRRGYLSIFQPQGVRALVVGREGDWYRVRLSHSQFGWVAKGSVRKMATGLLPYRSLLSSIRTYGTDQALRIEFPLNGRHAFRIFEDDKRSLRVQLFGVTTNTDWIRYDFSDSLVDIATWSQPEERMYELRLRLTRDLWGYDTYYDGNRLNVVLNKPPNKVKSLKGKTIVIDPGHSADPGAMGATGLTEAEANLGIALTLERELTKKGAHVVMTRRDDSDVPLYDRPTIAKLAEADLFVSIHNNALPDGVNPFTNNGVSSYYYHPHSIDLARSIQGEMIKATKQHDHGLFYGNLAVNRPTQYPAVLIECAFMMIPEQEEQLRTENYQKKVAKAIRKGIESFLKSYDQANR